MYAFETHYEEEQHQSYKPEPFSPLSPSVSPSSLSSYFYFDSKPDGKYQYLRTAKLALHILQAPAL